MSGRIQPRNLISIAASTNGILDAFFVDAGTEVYEGQLLARIRNGDVAASSDIVSKELAKLKDRVSNLEASVIATRLETSRAQADALRVRGELEKSQKLYERQQILLREGATPRLVFEKAEREFNALKTDADSRDGVAKQAEERANIAAQDLDATRGVLDQKTKELEAAQVNAASGEVHAPSDGLIISRRGLPGDPVDRTVKDLFQLAIDRASMEVAIEPEPPLLSRVKAGQAAFVRVAEVPDQAISGTVREIRNTRVFIDFQSPTANIKPGSTAQVTIPLH